MRIAFAAFLLTCYMACGAAAEPVGSLTIVIKPPSTCVLAVEVPGQWACNYVSRNTRKRSILMNFHELKFVQNDRKARKTLRSLNAEALETVLEKNIMAIDKGRERAQHTGEYLKREYGFLATKRRPNGFQACSRLIDQMTLKSSGVRIDRASLHCWAVDQKQGTAHQLLLSLMEYNHVGDRATPDLGKEFDRIVRTVGRK